VFATRVDRLVVDDRFDDLTPLVEGRKGLRVSRARLAEPTRSSTRSARSKASRSTRTWPLWNGWNRPM
jgi:hypothetical protein